MAQTIQRLVAKNGKYLVLPVWVEGDAGYGRLAHPDVYVLEAQQKYPIGTKFVDGDRIFHYGYIYSDTGSYPRGGSGLGDLNEMLVFTLDGAVEPIGETEIKIEDTNSTKDQWAGGLFWPYMAPYYTGHRILGNTLQDGEHVILTLERGLLVAMTAGLTLNELYANPYTKLNACIVTGDYSTSTMGILLPGPVASRYCWLQTWGPCIVAGGDEVPGSEAGYRACGINIDGTLVHPTGHDGQRIGHIINDTAATYIASHYVMLQIAC